MASKAAVIDIIYRALEALNQELPVDKQVPLNSSTRLFGPGATLDSLSLVSLIVDVEAGVTDELGHVISLTDDQALGQAVSPFSSVDALADYILKQLMSV
jgi:acyl carrier protein